MYVVNALVEVRGGLRTETFAYKGDSEKDSNEEYFDVLRAFYDHLNEKWTSSKVVVKLEMSFSFSGVYKG